MSEADASDEVIETVVRTAMTGAAQVGQSIARARQKRADDARRESAAAARDYTSRFNAERELAAKWLERTRRDEWWSSAEPRDAVQAYEVATTWEEHGEPFGTDAARRIEHQTQQRWDMSIDDVRRDQHEAAWKQARDLEQARQWGLENRPALLAEYERLSVADALLTDAQRQEAAASRERLDADILAAWADRHRDHEQQAVEDDPDTERERNNAAEDEVASETKWDSAERREAYAEQLREDGDVDRKTAEASIANDRNNASAPTDAAGAQQKRYAKPKGRRRTPGRQREKNLSR